MDRSLSRALRGDQPSQNISALACLRGNELRAPLSCRHGAPDHLRMPCGTAHTVGTVRSTGCEFRPGSLAVSCAGLQDVQCTDGVGPFNRSSSSVFGGMNLALTDDDISDKSTYTTPSLGTVPRKEIIAVLARQPVLMKTCGEDLRYLAGYRHGACISGTWVHTYRGRTV